MATTTELAAAFTRAEICSLLHYCPESGILTWINPPSPSPVKVGDVAGRTHRTGYVRLKLQGVEFAAHRIAWFMQIGEWPEADIDHIDGNRSNNAWANLRAATRQENSRNRHGTKGVMYDVSNKAWLAYIDIGGHLLRKLFETKEEAFDWRVSMEAEHFGAFAPLRRAA